METHIEIIPSKYLSALPVVHFPLIVFLIELFLPDKISRLTHVAVSTFINLVVMQTEKIKI